MSSEFNRKRLYHGAYGICRDPLNRLLLVRVTSGLADAGLWTLPGGGIEWGEPPEIALHRELEEETGVVDVKKSRLAAVYSQVYENPAYRKGEAVHHIGFVYDVTFEKFDLRAEKDGSTDRCEWFSESQARQLPLGQLGAFGVELAWPIS